MLATALKPKQIDVNQEPVSSLVEYGRVPISFEIRNIFDVSTADGKKGDLVLTEPAVDKPAFKDYDALVGEASLPILLPERIRSWHRESRRLPAVP